ncbi:phospho-N-acetylmuramoyl-pentapeptide-transferase [Clostridium sporogenes]|nr:phospho-N-acetylmuramoyl-pentapeptide-transferase [Clostridium sporogenes]
MNRIVYAVLLAFLISILGGPILIPLLHKFKFGQNIREEGPKSHRKKQVPLLWAELYLYYHL